MLWSLRHYFHTLIIYINYHKHILLLSVEYIISLKGSLLLIIPYGFY